MNPLVLPLACPLRPLRDHVIVRPLCETQQGVIQLVQFGRKWRRGEVLAVGPGKRDRNGVPQPWGTRVGDVVQFADVLTYPEFDTGTERVLVLQEADICGVEEAEYGVQVIDKRDPNAPDTGPMPTYSEVAMHRYGGVDFSDKFQGAV